MFRSYTLLIQGIIKEAEVLPELPGTKTRVAEALPELPEARTKAAKGLTAAG